MVYVTLTGLHHFPLQVVNHIGVLPYVKEMCIENRHTMGNINLESFSQTYFLCVEKLFRGWTI